MAGHHHAHVDNVKVVALQHHGDDVFANVVYVALDGGNHDLALARYIQARRLLLALFFLDVGNEVGHGLLHHARAFHHLGQKHFARAKQVADDVHAVHQRPFDDVQRAAALLHHELLVGLFGVFGDEVGDAVYQRVRQALAHGFGVVGRAAPFEFFAFVLGRAFGGFGNFQEAFGGIVAAVQDHVFHALAQLGVQVVVHPDHAGIDDAHVHPGLDGVVQKDGVNRFAHRFVAPKAKAHVGDPAADFGPRQVGLDPAHGVDEIDGVVGVLFDAGGNGEDVGVEDDVFGRKPHLIDQDAVGAFADFDLALKGVGLAFFVKGHDHGGRAVAFDEPRLVLEFVHPFFHRDGIDNALALQAAQARFDHFPLGAIDHHRHFGDVRLRADQVQKAHHGGLAVEHGLVHVHVDHLGPVFHLLARHGQGFFVLLVQNHPREGFGAGDVGALAHVHKQRVLTDKHRLQARELHGGNGLNRGHGGHSTHFIE